MSVSRRPCPTRTPLQTGDVVGEHACPVCGAGVGAVYRPGRARIYCSNACRQRAYRWRRAAGIRLCVERNGPAQGLHNARRHAVRDHRDPVTGISDRRRRVVTVCGTFAAPLSGRFATHTVFVPESDWACRTCTSLIGVGPFGTGIPDVVRQFASFRRR